MRNFRYRFLPITWMISAVTTSRNLRDQALRAHLTVFSLILMLLIANTQASGQTVAGTECVPANQKISTVSNPGQLTQQSKNQTPASPSSHLGPGSIDIIPGSPTTVGNCIPFGNNTSYDFTGFIYRNVPAFTLSPGHKIAFDLGEETDQDVRRNIYFAVANKNPDPPVVSGNNVVSQGVKALSWIQVVSDAQIPLNPRGNFVSGDYELVYTSEGTFNFPGGGLIVGFGGSPPGAYADGGCEQVLVQTTASDASGFFYSRFFFKPDRTLGDLDDITGGGSAVALGGIVIQGGVSASISGTKFNDLNANGSRDAGEPGLAGWKINITGDTTATTTTDGQGKYTFAGLKKGNYTVAESLQSGWLQTFPAPPGKYSIALDSAQVDTGRNFGNFRPSSISGRKWFDVNFNGINDGEPGLPGWLIVLSGPVNRTTTTDGSGNYVFTNLVPGTYSVVEQLQPGWSPTFPPPVNPFTPAPHVFVLISGKDTTGINFGNRSSGGRGTLRGTAYDDRNGNGRRDAGEPAISGRRIDALTGSANYSTLTEANGEYTFNNIQSGDYTVSQFMPSGWAQTQPAGGAAYTIPLSSGQTVTAVDFGSRIVTAVEELGGTPTEYKLYQNYPNPFNPTTRITFDIPNPGMVTLKIFNVLGVEVATLVEGWKPTGRYNVTWDADGLPSGVYVYQLRSGSNLSVKKMVLMR